MRKSVTRLHPAILDRIIPAAVSQALHARLASLLAIQTVTPSCYAARGLDRHSCSITLYVLGGQRAPTYPACRATSIAAHAPTRPPIPKREPSRKRDSENQFRVRFSLVESILLGPILKRVDRIVTRSADYDVAYPVDSVEIPGAIDSADVLCENPWR